ncbi:MAG: hypothetical protein HYZ28_06390 [Myxococcales bacterium]|nr:hypothetical protein [Myxococcales bacterium]
MKRALPLASCLLAAAAQAYILPYWSILREMAERRDNLQLSTLKVEGGFSFHGPGAEEASAALGVPAEGAELSADGAVYLRLPGRCRIEATSPVGGAPSASIFAGGKARSAGGEISALKVAAAEVCAFLAMRSGSEQEGRALIERHLQRIGVDVKETSLARFAGQVVYVLGQAKAEKPQVWIYKESFLPAKVRLSDEQGASWEVRFVDYSSPASGEWFPRTLEVHRGGELLVKFTAHRADARAKLDEKLFQ